MASLHFTDNDAKDVANISDALLDDASRGHKVKETPAEVVTEVLNALDIKKQEVVEKLDEEMPALGPVTQEVKELDTSDPSNFKTLTAYAKAQEKHIRLDHPMANRAIVQRDLEANIQMIGLVSNGLLMATKITEPPPPMTPIPLWSGTYRDFNEIRDEVYHKLQVQYGQRWWRYPKITTTDFAAIFRLTESQLQVTLYAFGLDKPTFSRVMTGLLTLYFFPLQRSATTWTRLHVADVNESLELVMKLAKLPEKSPKESPEKSPVVKFSKVLQRILKQTNIETVCIGFAKSKDAEARITEEKTASTAN